MNKSPYLNWSNSKDKATTNLKSSQRQASFHEMATVKTLIFYIKNSLILFLLLSLRLYFPPTFEPHF